MTKRQKEKFIHNLFVFSAPVLAIFFAQLAMGVEWKPAGLVALYAFYAGVSDYMKKVK